jgi:hypothetical protein
VSYLGGSQVLSIHNSGRQANKLLWNLIEMPVGAVLSCLDGIFLSLLNLLFCSLKKGDDLHYHGPAYLVTMICNKFICLQDAISGVAVPRLMRLGSMLS